jgi:hypothetical protein
MVYGAIKRRPVHLLPFFCFQVFDLIIACLTAVGHYTWLPSIQRAIIESVRFAFVRTWREYEHFSRNFRSAIS